MRTLSQLSRMFFKPVNGKATTPPASPQRTRDGWPLGTRKLPAGTWITFIEPLAYAKLMTWYRESKGLELSGYALLAEPVNAKRDQDAHFHVKDLMLVCAIEESSRGYTEMSAEQRVRAMMNARAIGYKANQLGWWHHHPVVGWSGTDVNTLRQRVHELGLPEVLQAFSFVLTPNGIRARWDQSGPNEEDNIYVDEIPVMIGDPSLLDVMHEAEAEVKELLAERAKPFSKEATKEAPAKTIPMPTPSWQRPISSWQGAFFQASMWDGWLECDPDEIYFYDLAYTEAATEAIANVLGPNEDPYEFVCRKDSETLVCTEACATCPFMAGCFSLNLLELEAETQRILEGAL
jgi:hypothetical protein